MPLLTSFLQLTAAPAWYRARTCCKSACSAAQHSANSWKRAGDTTGAGAGADELDIQMCMEIDSAGRDLLHCKFFEFFQSEATFFQHNG
jgi:hypothetical protein